jgi:UDP-glucose 4-epimerase
MKILVTGGAGFIASHVAEAYVSAGHEVVVVDNLSTGRRKNLPPGVDFVEMSINDDAFPGLVRSLSPEVINHHAAQMDVRRSVQDPVFDATENVLGSLRLMIAAVSADVRKIVYASTGGATYGDVSQIPVSESVLPNPVCQYGVSKHTVEHYLFVYRRLYGLDYTVLRYPNVYGPRQNPHGEAGVVAIFAGQMLRGEQPTIFGDGSKSRDYVHVRDIVRANLLALDAGSGCVLNLGSGRETTDREVFDAVAAAVGYRDEPAYARVRPGEVDRICLDATAAAEQLGWVPLTEFRAGAAETAKWISENRDYLGDGQ